MITAPPAPTETILSKNLRCRIVTNSSDFEALAPDWKRLWALDPAKEIFQSIEWARAWLRAFGKDHALFAAVVDDGNETVLILPLVVRNREMRFLGYSTSDYNDALASPTTGADALGKALEGLFHAQSRCWDRLVLENVREDSTLSRWIPELPERWQRVLHVGPPVACPLLNLGDSRQETLTEILNRDKVKKTSKTIRRLGTVGFRHIDNAVEIRQHLPRFVEQHVARCALDGRRSQFLEGDYEAFCEYLIDGLDARSDLRFSVLEIDGRPAAYHLGFEVDGKYLFYKPTFDIDLWDYSPGQVLLFRLFDEFRGSSVRAFDFGQGPEQYKYRYSNATRDNHTYTVFSPDWSGRIKCRVAAAVLNGRRLLRNQLEKWAKPEQIQTALEEQRMRWRDSGVLKKLTLSPGPRAKLYTLPQGDSPARRLRLQPVTFSMLAGRTAQDAAFLTPYTLRRLRERIKKGSAVYVDHAWTCIVLVSPADAGLVFVKLASCGADPKALLLGMAEVAHEKGARGWLLSDGPEAGLQESVAENR